jgi:hypothetical protein
VFNTSYGIKRKGRDKGRREEYTKEKLACRFTLSWASLDK